jgi:hypothetical protein
VCSGNIVKAKEIYSELKERLKTEYISPYILLLCANSLRNTEEARFFLQKAMEERSTSLDVYAKEDPTFRKLIERINAHLPMQPTRDSAR